MMKRKWLNVPWRRTRDIKKDFNDSPQTVRWKVTSKEALSQISEYSEAGITVRGTYFAPKQQPKEEERKLYLAIEATLELAIQKAKKEITRLIKEEELVWLQNSYQPINKIPGVVILSSGI